MISFPQRLAERRKQLCKCAATKQAPRNVSLFDAEEKQVVRSVLKGMILKHEARRWQRVSNGERK